MVLETYKLLAKVRFHEDFGPQLKLLGREWFF